MAPSLCMMQATMKSAAVLGSSTFRAQRIAPFTSPSAMPLHGCTVVPRRSLVVVAATKKGLDPAEQRDKLAKAKRLYNRSRRSAVATRVKKVIKLATEYKAKIEVIASEADVKPLETLISEAYIEIDKAVSKNVLHKNTAARRKARIAKYKRDVLIQAGLYTPAPGQPGYKAPKVAAARS